MSDEKLLSKEELDALLERVDSGKVAAHAARVEPGDVRNYDFSRQDRIARDRFPALGMVNQRFARHLRAGLFKILRRSCDVSVIDSRMERYSDYLQALKTPTSLNLVRANPLRGTGLIVFESALVYNMVESYFGGGRFKAHIERPDFTPTESRLVQIVLGEVFSAMTEAWSSLVKLHWEYLSSEVNPQFTTIVGATEPILVSRFRIGLDSDAADLHVVLPNSMIEPIRELLESGMQSDRVEKDEQWSRRLREDVLDVEIEFGAKLMETQISIGDCLRMRSGDIIPLDRPDRVTVFAENVPVYRGLLGTSSGNNAVRLSSPLRTSDRESSELAKDIQ